MLRRADTAAIPPIDYKITHPLLGHVSAPGPFATWFVPPSTLSMPFWVPSHTGENNEICETRLGYRLGDCDGRGGINRSGPKYRISGAGFSRDTPAEPAARGRSGVPRDTPAEPAARRGSGVPRDTSAEPAARGRSSVPRDTSAESAARGRSRVPRDTPAEPAAGRRARNIVGALSSDTNGRRNRLARTGIRESYGRRPKMSAC
jgi:hypothetical protein